MYLSIFYNIRNHVVISVIGCLYFFYEVSCRHCFVSIQLESVLATFVDPIDMLVIVIVD